MTALGTKQNSFLGGMPKSTWKAYQIQIHLYLYEWGTFIQMYTYSTFDVWRHDRAVNRLENVRQSNIRRGKKLGVQLSHKQALYITIFEKIFKSNFNFEPFKRNKKFF